jgi:hypothetical protein
VGITTGYFPHLGTKLDDKLARKVALVSLQQTNLVCNKLLTDKQDKNEGHFFVRRLCEQVCHQVCLKNVMVETHLNIG